MALVSRSVACRNCPIVLNRHKTTNRRELEPNGHLAALQYQPTSPFADSVSHKDVELSQSELTVPCEC